MTNKIFFFLVLFIPVFATAQEDVNRCRLHVDSLFDYLKSDCDLKYEDYERFFLHSSEHEVSWRLLMNDEVDRSDDICEKYHFSYSLVLIKMQLASRVHGIYNLKQNSISSKAVTEFYTDYLVNLEGGISLIFRFDLRRSDTTKIVDMCTEDYKSLLSL